MKYNFNGLTVEATYYKGCRGARDGRYGPPIEPDEPPMIEIESVKDQQGNEVELTEKEMEEAEEAGFRYLEDR